VSFNLTISKHMTKKSQKGQYIDILLRAPQTVFTVKEIALLWREERDANFRARLGSYVKSGKLIRLHHGIYAKDEKYDRLELAGKVYTPAYISFETVLIRSGINFQYYESIFLASYLSREIKIDNQKLIFTRIKKDVLTNMAGIKNYKGFSIASKERAFLDRIYISKDYYFDNLLSIDWKKVFKILPIYKSKRMDKKVKKYHENFLKDL
jgi:hypothetical protein